jgi:hypothetical protein
MTMKKVIKQLKDNVWQITTVDERWYLKEDKVGDNIVQTFVPSVTWVCSYLPKGIGYMKWLAEHGWDESQALMRDAGDKGSKVHEAIALLLDGETVKMDDKLLNKDTGELEEITVEEYECIMSFVRWFNEVNPKIIAKDFLVMKGCEYAGMIDLLCEIDGVKYVVDFKTSQTVFDSHEIQVAAYKHALDKPEEYACAILQVGYRKNKAGFKWNKIDDKIQLFEAAKVIWYNTNEGVEPKQKDYPMSLTLTKEG